MIYIHLLPIFATFILIYYFLQYFFLNLDKFHKTPFDISTIMRINIVNCKIRLALGIMFLILFQTKAQKSSKTDPMVDNNFPILDSMEKAKLPKMVLLEDAFSIENPSQRKNKKQVEIRSFQEVNSFKIKLFVDNKFKKKVTISVLDSNGITIFEDFPSEKIKYQKLFDMTFLTDKVRYFFTAFYENQNHYFFPILADSKEILEEIANLSSQYPIEKGKK